MKADKIEVEKLRNNLEDKIEAVHKELTKKIESGIHSVRSEI